MLCIESSSNLRNIVSRMVRHSFFIHHWILFLYADCASCNSNSAVLSALLTAYLPFYVYNSSSSLHFLVT